MKIKASNISSWLLTVSPLFITFLATKWGARNPMSVEKLYAQGIYPVLAKYISTISNIFSFSISDVFYLSAILGFLLLICLLLFRKIKLLKAIKILFLVISIAYTTFYFFWGFNYFRADLYQRLQLKKSEANTEDFISICTKLINTTNTQNTSFKEFDKTTIDHEIETSYQQLSEILRLNFPAGKRTDKSITFSTFFAQSGISGYFGPFFNEVHVNKQILPIEYPFVLAHEKAHQLGVTSESEANFYAWLICSSSKNKQLRYSANLTILRHFLYQAYELPNYKELLTQLDEDVINDLREIQKHWQEMRNEKLNKAASRVNDAYLKTNNVKEGIKDYRGVVKHVMNFSLDSAFQEKHALANR